MSERRRALAGRDQRVSAFGATLLRLCDAGGALGAALVDGEGETVDYAGSLDPFDIKIAAAEWAIVAALLRASRVPGWSGTEEIVVRGTHKSFAVHSLTAGYSLVMQLPRRSFAVSRRALAEAIRELSVEAGLELPSSLARQSDRWFRVDVRCRDALRPEGVWILSAWAPVEIIGRWAAGEHRGELAYRVRLTTGAELTLLREPLGRWYADAHIL